MSLAWRERPRVEFGILGDGGSELRRLAGLAAGQIGGLESAGVVLVLGLVLLAAWPPRGRIARRESRVPVRRSVRR